MSTWTPAQRELTGGVLTGRSVRAAIALTLVALGLAAAAFDAVLVVRDMALPWEQSALFGVAVASLAAGGALVLTGKSAAQAEALAPAAPPTTGIVLTGSVASDVVLDYDAGTAAKVYRPTAPVKLLYGLSFQAAFPYTTNEPAFIAAAERRAIAGLLTEYWFGENHVSQVVEIRNQEDGRFVFVTELVRGTLPRDTRKARAFLNELQGHFEEAGIAPWQVASYNPRAIGNIIERTDGAYRIIDLESNLVSPFLRPRVLWQAVRAGLYPSFDAIDVDRLDAYLARHRDALYASLGEAGANALFVSAANYRVAQQAWHASERRWASKVLRAAAVAIDVPGWFRAIGRLSRGGERMATEAVSAGIETWVDEGLMAETEAEAARATLKAPEMTAATASLGAHLAMSVPLRFPLGSIARSGWTIAARARGEVRGLRDAEARRSARSVHSTPVALLGAIPGFGAFAYLAAKPFREQRVLRAVMFDQALRHLPFKLHSRLHLSALSRWMALPAQAAVAGSRRVAAAGAWPALAASAAGALAGLMLLNGRPSDEVVDRAAWAAVAVAGVGALVAFRSFWSHSATQDIASQAGSFAWALVGLGALVAGIDMALSIHTGIFAAVERVELPMVPGGHEAHVLTMAAYGLLAGATAWAFRHEFTAPRASSVALSGATGLLIGVAVAEAASLEATPVLAFAAAAALGAAAALRIAEAGGARAFRASRPGAAVIAWSRFASRTAERRYLVPTLLGLSVLVAAVSIPASYVIDPDSAEPAFYRDFGPVTVYSSALMLLAGTMGLAAWRRDRTASGRGLGRDLWAAWGLAFVVLAFDATPNFHGHIGGLIQSATPFDHPFGFHRPSDFIVAVYGLAGLGISLLLWRQVFEHPVAILYFAGAVPFAMLTVAVDGFASHGWAPCVIEEGAELMAISFFAGAFARRLREARQPRAAQVTAFAPRQLEAVAA